MAKASLKHLFWELLSYNRVREQLHFFTPPSAIEFMTSLEVFAATDAFTIVMQLDLVPLDGRLEQMIWP